MTVGLVFRIVRYLVGAAFVVVGAGYLALGLAMPLASMKDIASQPHLDVVRHAFTNADPKQLAIGAAVVLVGFLVAKAPFSITFAAKRRPRKRPPFERAVQDLSSPDPEVRLAALETLTAAAKPSTIPHLIKALGDPTTKVRGQACEALASISGETFDFVDIAPAPTRAESIARWEAWWQAGREAILSGTDPRELAKEPVGVPSAAASPAATPAAGRRRRPPRRKTSKTVPVSPPPSEGPAGMVPDEPELPPLDDEEAPLDEIAGAGAPAPAAPPPKAARAPGAKASPESGRNLSLGDMVRRKRMREGREAGKSRRPKSKTVVPPRPAAPPTARKEQPQSPEETDQELLSDTEINPDELPPDNDELPPPDDDELPTVD